MPGIGRKHWYPARLVVVLLALVPPGLVAAAESATDSGTTRSWQLPEPDTSGWRCRLCPFPSGWQGELNAGAGYVSDDSYRFGDYRGLEEQGGFLSAGGEVRYFGEDADYLDLRFDEPALDSRSLHLEGGRQGHYRGWFEYEELPHLLHDETRSVYTNVGSGTLSLPGGWTRASTTGGMTALEASLREAEIEQDRTSLGLGVDLLHNQRWRYSLEYLRDTREGRRMTGGSFLFNSVLLPEPVDYRTERMEASVAYVRERWQLETAYHVSLFHNEADALIWDNPFTSANGADRGRAAGPPDNQFHQMMFSGSWRPGGSVTVAGRVALGRMEQDEAFLPATINSGLSVPPLPRADLDAEVATRTANLRVTARPAPKLTTKLELSRDERDNDTERDAWTQVSTDELVTSARYNRPYGYSEDGAKVRLDYRFSSGLKLAGGAGREEMDRTWQESRHTVTDTRWLELQGQPAPRVAVKLRGTREERDGSHDPLGLSPPEHPGMRKYHQADRTREASRLRLDFLASDKVTLGVSARRADDVYNHSEVGLTDAVDDSYSLDLGLVPKKGVSVNAFFSLQSSEAVIAGQDNLNGAPWQAEQEDEWRTLGGGVSLDDLPGKFTEGGVEMTLADGDTRIRQDKFGVSAPGFPPLESRLYTIRMHAERPLFDNAALQLQYLMEGFSESDFQRDGVSPDTVSNLLAMDAGSPGYTVQVIRVLFRYRF